MSHAALIGLVLVGAPAGGEVVISFEKVETGKPVPGYTDKDTGVEFALSRPPARSKAAGRVMFFPHLKTDRKGILNAMADESIPVEVRFPKPVSGVTLELWGSIGSAALVEAYDQDGKVVDTAKRDKVPERTGPEQPIPNFKLTVTAPAIASVRFSGAPLGGYLVCDEVRFTPRPEPNEPEKPGPTTYCNPISLPNYPIGRRARDVTAGAPVPKDDWLWLVDRQQQFRELADVSVVWHEGAWYLYPSVDMAWVSTDGGATWRHHPLNVRDLGYAPTIVKHKGKFLLMASESPVYSSASPLGPFQELGPIKLPSGVPGQIDPMLFSDEGRLFYYWGCTPTEGIFGVEVDADDPTRVIGKPAKVIAFEPNKQPWQRLGDWNEQPARGWVEGAWMFKRGGKYYLTYAAAGTENRTYATGCAVGQSPLGPFVPQKINPILRSTTGLVTGTAHGCVVEGPHNSLWAFYTVRAGVVHGFERRLGMDPAHIGEDGELRVDGASSLPRRLPTAAKAAEPAGWLPLNAGPRTVGSSDAPNLSGRLAVDDDLRTWWQPASDDKAPTLASNLTTPGAVVRAVRLVWRDVGLDTKKGAKPGAFRYKVDVRTAADTWTTVIDRGRSTDDLLIDYRECPATPGTAARLVIVGAPPGITPGVAEFTVFADVRRR
jgi:xylan 1,4-beta-xylosidase